MSELALPPTCIAVAPQKVVYPALVFWAGAFLFFWTAIPDGALQAGSIR